MNNDSVTTHDCVNYAVWNVIYFCVDTVQNGIRLPRSPVQPVDIVSHHLLVTRREPSGSGAGNGLRLWMIRYDRPMGCYAPSSRRGIKRWCCLTSDVCLSVAYIGRKSRTKRPRKTNIGIEVAHVTCDSDITFKVERSKVKVTVGGGILWRPPAQLV